MGVAYFYTVSFILSALKMQAWLQIKQNHTSQWTWVWVNSGSWWWTGRPGVLQSMGSQRVEHDWATKLNWTDHFGINQGFLCSLISKSEFSPKADPNAKTRAQVVYLGDGPGNQGLGDRQKEMGQEEDVIADASLRNLLLRTSGA